MDEQVERTIQELAERLTPADYDQTLDTITRAAVDLLPHVDYASLTVSHQDGTVHSYAATAEVLVDLDELQNDLREGPATTR